MPAPAAGLALPLVLVLATGCHMALAAVLELERHDVRSGPAQVRSAQSLAAAEHALQTARQRLDGALTFPTSGCAAGLCVNLQAPAPETYDWATGTAHTPLAGAAGGGYWIESLGSVAAGQFTDCPGSNGGCEYLRVVASAAPEGVRRSLEACYRIRRGAGLAPVITRISWRQTVLP